MDVGALHTNQFPQEQSFFQGRILIQEALTMSNLTVRRFRTKSFRKNAQKLEQLQIELIDWI